MFLIVEVLDENQQIIQTYKCDPKYSTDVIQQQVRAQVIVHHSEKNRFLNLKIEGEEQSLNTLLVKSLHQDVWVKDQNGQEFFNNYPIINPK